MNFLTLLLIFSMSITTSSLFLGGGGGGGCGCMSSCGRKKRSIEPPQFNNMESKDTDILCNSPELRQLIVQNMKDTPEESGRSLSAILEQHGEPFVVVCSEHRFSYFIRHDSEFCGVRNGTHYCQAFAL
ncbi:unnamed protein product [Auanema sp. JU1783]|nr:unnamed protein product [Auanema sp. JU1783]